MVDSSMGAAVCSHTLPSARLEPSWLDRVSVTPPQRIISTGALRRRAWSRARRRARESDAAAGLLLQGRRCSLWVRLQLSGARSNAWLVDMVALEASLRQLSLDLVEYGFDDQPGVRTTCVHIARHDSLTQHESTISEDCHSRHQAGRCYMRIRFGAESGRVASNGGPPTAPKLKDERHTSNVGQYRKLGDGQLVALTWHEPQDSMSVDFHSDGNKLHVSTSWS